MGQYNKPDDTTAKSNKISHSSSLANQDTSGKAIWKPGEIDQNFDQASTETELPEIFAGHKRLTARLVFDSRDQSNATEAGLRSLSHPAHDASYQLLYILDDGQMEVDLELSHSSRTHPYNLTGQVMGAKGKDRRAYLISRAGGAMMEASIDETYTFKFQNLAQGEYRLNVICDRELIEIVLLSL